MKLELIECSSTNAAFICPPTCAVCALGGGCYPVCPGACYLLCRCNVDCPTHCPFNCSCVYFTPPCSPVGSPGG